MGGRAGVAVFLVALSFWAEGACFAAARECSRHLGFFAKRVRSDSSFGFDPVLQIPERREAIIASLKQKFSLKKREELFDLDLRRYRKKVGALRLIEQEFLFSILFDEARLASTQRLLLPEVVSYRNFILFEGLDAETLRHQFPDRLEADDYEALRTATAADFIPTLRSRLASLYHAYEATVETYPGYPDFYANSYKVNSDTGDDSEVVLLTEKDYALTPYDIFRNDQLKHAFLWRTAKRIGKSLIWWSPAAYSLYAIQAWDDPLNLFFFVAASFAGAMGTRPYIVDQYRDYKELQESLY